MHKGKFVVIDGNDGVGKTSVIKGITAAMASHWPGKITTTFSPGDTPLGAHLRQLVKFPQEFGPDIKIDSLSRQLLYIIDTIDFVNTKLKPALDAGDLIISDRSSFVSAMVYGMAEGLKYADIARLFNLIIPPRMHRLYVLQCDSTIARQRLVSRGERQDHFESKPSEFYNLINNYYNNLLLNQDCRKLLSHSVDLINVVQVNVTVPLDQVVSTIVSDLKESLL